MQPDDDQQQRLGEAEVQESDSLRALKAILARVAALLQPLQLTQDESIRLVEQLYGSVLDMDVRLAGETDDRRKSSVLAHIQNTSISRTDGRIVVEYPSPDALQALAVQGDPAQGGQTPDETRPTDNPAAQGTAAPSPAAQNPATQPAAAARPHPPAMAAPVTRSSPAAKIAENAAAGRSDGSDPAAPGEPGPDAASGPAGGDAGDPAESAAPAARPTTPRAPRPPKPRSPRPKARVTEEPAAD